MFLVGMTWVYYMFLVGIKRRPNVPASSEVLVLAYNLDSAQKPNTLLLIVFVTKPRIKILDCDFCRFCVFFYCYISKLISISCLRVGKKMISSHTVHSTLEL